MRTREMAGWASVIYRDEPDEASAQTVAIGFDERLEDARRRVSDAVAERRAADPRWAMWSATIDDGIRLERLASGGVWLEESFDRTGSRWYIGPDWQEEELP